MKRNSQHKTINSNCPLSQHYPVVCGVGGRHLHLLQICTTQDKDISPFSNSQIFLQVDYMVISGPGQAHAQKGMLCVFDKFYKRS